MANSSVSKIIDAPDTFKSKVWTHFSFYTIDGTNNIDKECAIYKNYLLKVKYTGNTMNMQSHLQHHHPDHS